MTDEENIKTLTENFFKNLSCDVKWKNDMLIIEKVPIEFEKIYRKAPYYFTFNELSHDINKESELITKGSTIPKLISQYLDNKAQTTLLKINFNTDINHELKSMIDFKNHTISNIMSDQKNEYIYRFIFLTNFQYLNEREQLITPMYIKDNKILEDFNIDDYKVVEGKKTDVKKEIEMLSEIKINYNIAKESLKTLTNSKIQEISKELNGSLEQGLARVINHYDNQILELDNETNKNTENLKVLSEKLLTANEKNKKIIEEKINKINYILQNSKNNEEKLRLEKEKQFFINDEKNKHSLNINNNLMNTTIIYYPVYNIKVFIKQKEATPKKLDFTFDPLKERLSEIYCDSCKKQINVINICSQNHLTCVSCIGKCPRCASKICKSCKTINCNVCGGVICQKCSTICARCMKHTCNSDLYKDSMTSKLVCKNCAEYCTICKKYANKNYYKMCEICKRNFCKNCMKEKYVDNKLKQVCKNCEPKVKDKPKFTLEL